MRLIFSTNALSLPSRTHDTIPVALYASGGVPPGGGRVGALAREAVRRLDRPTSATAFDFLTLALAVTAAETFVPRSAAADGWRRQFELIVPLAEPARWEPVRDRLADTLRFLTGDHWSFEFTGSGAAPPLPGRFRNPVNVAGHDSVCLFSGGLDSAIGAIDLLKDTRRPLLVSHAYRDDGPKQEWIMGRLPGPVPARFAVTANPRGGAAGQPDNTMRGRSLNFLAFATVAASAMQGGRDEAETQIVVPENGFIALNPPATLRRLGSLSTRTTHPHFLAGLEGILRQVGLPLRLVNPYFDKTKGEMLRHCADQDVLRGVAPVSVSCGKWKRSRTQCGKCVPCLIRRSSFHAAGWTPDPTHYSSAGTDLGGVLADGEPEQRGDLVAMLRAASILDTPEFERRVWLTGPLPLPATARAPYIEVARRGMLEVKTFLATVLPGEPSLQSAP